MRSWFFRQRLIWWPTALGWTTGTLIFFVPALLWVFAGEAFLGRTHREPAEILIVEGWIGIDGIRAAKAEFDQGGYKYVVATGGPTSNRWGSRRWNYALEAEELLLRLGVPVDRVILAAAPDTDAQRTFISATAVRKALQTRGLHPHGANVLTLGVHARRSRLIFAKALPDLQVGVVSWIPASDPRGPWWHSSERAEDLIKESVGYFFELLLNSGRTSNST